MDSYDTDNMHEIPKSGRWVAPQQGRYALPDGAVIYLRKGDVVEWVDGNLKVTSHS